VGESDLGVNRRRLEQIRLALLAKRSHLVPVLGETKAEIVAFTQTQIPSLVTKRIVVKISGLYAKVRAGEIHSFTGIDAPYEEPLNPDIICYTKQESVEESVVKIIAELERLG
jgi:adenylylsulfate kinase